MDLYKGGINVHASKQQQLWHARGATLVIMLSGWLLVLMVCDGACCADVT